MNFPVRNFDATPAIRKQVPLLIGIMSPSGGGKTFSALRLATGIQQVVGGDIYGLDTENGRMLHYADQFKFKHVPFAPPFGSLDYLAALKYCADQGSRITIVDSMTHEHVGEGGYLDTAESVIDRLAGNDYKKREAVKMLGWAKAGPLRQKMIEGIKQLDGAFIFCFRAKEKVKPVKNAEGKTEIIDMGFMPIAGEEWIYEMALNCMLEPRSEGIPTWRSDHVGERMMMKLPAQFKGIFAERQPLSEDIGRAMAEWARGGTVPASSAPVACDLPALGAAAAACGMEALRQFWSGLSKADKATVGGAAQLDAWKRIATDADTPDVSFEEPAAGHERVAAGPTEAVTALAASSGPQDGPSDAAATTTAAGSTKAATDGPKDAKAAPKDDPLLAEGADAAERGTPILRVFLQRVEKDGDGAAIKRFGQRTVEGWFRIAAQADAAIAEEEGAAT